MGRSLAFMVIGLFFGAGAGFFAAAANNVTLDGHDHGSHGKAAESAKVKKTAVHHHKHKQVDLAGGPNASTLKIRLVKDAMAGWNLRILTTNFRFAPEHVNKPPVVGEGHAHVYVNGRKIARLYSPWMHVGALPKGKVDVSVTLNANTHGPLAVDGKALKVTKTVTVE